MDGRGISGHAARPLQIVAYWKGRGDQAGRRAARRVAGEIPVGPFHVAADKEETGRADPSLRYSWWRRAPA